MKKVAATSGQKVSLAILFAVEMAGEETREGTGTELNSY
jgi:hypothetical protein